MTKLKKILFIIIPLVFVLIGVFFAIFVNVPRLEYSYNEYYGGYLVSTVYGNAKEYTIPEKYNDKKVVGVDTRAFYNHFNLENINFENPENITHIERLAFSECKSLKYINLEYTTHIAKNAFYNCISLDNLYVSARYIGASAFFGCENLKNITIGEDCKSIGSYAFGSCHSLEYLRLPEYISNIGDRCFYYSGLKELLVHNSLRNDDYIKTLDYVVYY